MRHGVKWTVGLLGALCLLAGGAYHWPVGSAKVGAEINSAISPRLGLHWRGPARATLALLPWPTLRVVGVELVGADDRSVLSAPAAQFPLSLAGLLGGRFVPLGATLGSPTAFIDLDAARAAAAEWRASSGAEDGAPPGLWSHVRLHGGVLHIVGAVRPFDTLIENLEGSFDWPGVDEPISFSLAGAWRDESVSIKGKIDNPREGLKKCPTGVSLAIDSRPLALAMGGTWGGDAASGFSGDVSAQIRSLGALERLLGAHPASLIVGDSLSLEGKAQTHGASLALSEARFELAGQKFEGALTLSREGERTAISGTLAAESLKIEPLVGAPSTFFNAQGAWSSEPFGFTPPRGLDLDLRISAAHADWRGHRLDDAAGSLICKDGRLTAKLLEAGAYQGVVKGQLTLARGANGLETQMAGSLVDADVGAALADFGWSGYRGRGGFDFSLRSTGFAPADSVASLTGAASLDLQPGVVDGVSIEEAMRRSLRRPIDVARDMAIGQTTFSRARAQFAVAKGIAAVSGARVEGPGAALAIDGEIDMAAREFHARLAATQADAEGAPSANAARLTIVLDGPWSAPTVAILPGGG
ncbi:MAG: AsmA-like C-terminal region-containing protein [Roseiarcus sp.]